MGPFEPYGKLDPEIYEALTDAEKAWIGFVKKQVK